MLNKAEAERRYLNDLKVGLDVLMKRMVLSHEPIRFGADRWGVVKAQSLGDDGAFVEVLLFQSEKSATDYADSAAGTDTWDAIHGGVVVACLSFKLGLSNWCCLKEIPS